MAKMNLSKLRIINYPDPVLSRPGEAVSVFDDDLRALAARMFELMREAKGVGLAAPQVGRSLRLFVCNATGEPKDDLVFVNPRFVSLSGGDEKEEGCLSIPGVTVKVRRATQVVMEARDLHGQALTASAAELMARIWQHESDHLDGRLIIDRMSPTDEIANRRALKQLRDDYKPKRK
jgi:peptide deformylase